MAERLGLSGDSSQPEAKVASRNDDIEIVELSDTAIGSPPSLRELNVQEKLSMIQAVRKWPKISWWCLGLTSAIILTGFDISIISSVASLPEFQHDFGQKFEDTYIIPALWLGLWNASVPIGAIAGSAIGGMFQDTFGRRWSTAIASVLSALCVMIAFIANTNTNIDTRRGVFLIAKTFQGFGNGMILCTCETYMSENLPPALRGPGLALFPIFTLIGQLVGSIVVQVALDIQGAASYRTAFASQWPFTALPLVIAVFLPESPPWLIRVQKLDLARKCHQRLDNSPTDADRDAAFEEIHQTILLELKQSAFQDVSYMQCFQRTDTRRTLVIIFTHLIPMFFGLPLFATASYFLQTIGMSASRSILFILIGVVLGLISNVGAFWTLTHFGRRLLLLVSLSTATVLWASIGLAGCFSGDAMIWYVALCMMVTLITVGLGAWPASHVVAAETSSLRLRARSQGVGGVATNLANGAFSIVLPYIYNPDSGNLGARVGFVFSAFCAIAVFLTWQYIPELKDRTNNEIDEMFELRLKTREFKRWSGGNRTALNAIESNDRVA